VVGSCVEDVGNGEEFEVSTVNGAELLFPDPFGAEERRD